MDSKPKKKKRTVPKILFPDLISKSDGTGKFLKKTSIFAYLSLIKSGEKCKCLIKFHSFHDIFYQLYIYIYKPPNSSVAIFI